MPDSFSQDVQLLSPQQLVRRIFTAEAIIDATDLDLVRSRRIDRLGQVIHEAKGELLRRMGGGSISFEDKDVVDELINELVASANSGEEKSPELRAKLDYLEGIVLQKAELGERQLQTA